MKLYDLSGPYRELQRLAEDGEDVEPALAKLDDVLEVKAERLLAVLRGLEADMTALDAEAQQLAKRKRKLAATEAQLRGFLVKSMTDAKIERIKCRAFTMWLKQSDAVIVDDEEAIPDDFMRVKTIREPNKTLILNAHRERQEIVPGTHIEQRMNLQVT